MSSSKEELDSLITRFFGTPTIKAMWDPYRKYSPTKRSLKSKIKRHTINDPSKGTVTSFKKMKELAHQELKIIEHSETP